MAIKVPVDVNPVQPKVYRNEYNREGFQHMFYEKIDIDRQTGVFQQWSQTKYTSTKSPLSNGLCTYEYP
ncbi:MAG: hypothetical protein ACI86H_001858 [bacterium]|jgi:hypothetical protein